MSQDTHSLDLPRYNLPLTAMEQQAVLDARQDFANALDRIGKLERFSDATKDEMCIVIAAIWNGLRASMQRQSELDDEIPF